MLVLPLASPKSTRKAYGGDLNTLKMPRKVKLPPVPPKLCIYNERLETNINAPVFAIKAKTGEKIKYYSDTCVTSGIVQCIMCPMQFDVIHNTGIIIDQWVEDDVMHCVTTKVTCCHECSLAFVIDQKQKGSNMPEEYRSSYKYHLMAHARQYPDEGPLMPRGDRSQLIIHGGSMSYEAWATEGHSLVKSPTMIISNAKSMYSK
jgi:hypothetical protein